MTPVRILIADDNQLVRRGVAGLISAEQGYEVCGEAADAREAIEKACALRPDLLLLDVSMPDRNGLETARILREKVPETKILIMSQHDPVQLRARTLEAGAHGCVDKARIVQELFPAIREALEL